MIDNPHNYPDPGDDRAWRRSRIVNVSRSSRRSELRRQHHAAVPGPARRVQGHAVSRHRPAWSCTTRCRSTRSSTTSSTRSRPAPRGYASLDYEMIRLPPVRAGEGGYAAQRRPVSTRCRFIVHTRQGVRRARASCAKKLKEQHPAAAVRDSDTGGHRRQDHRPRDRQGHCARTCWPSATAAISAEEKTALKSRRRAKRKCARSCTVQVPTEAFLRCPQAG